MTHPRDRDDERVTEDLTWVLDVEVPPTSRTLNRTDDDDDEHDHQEDA